MEVKYKLFRKGLSTVVETVLEKVENKPFNHFINNVVSIVRTVENIEEFARQAYQARQEGLESIIKAEMFEWYTKKAGYNAEVAKIVIDYVTDIVFITIGGTYQMVEEIKEYKNTPKEN